MPAYNFQRQFIPMILKGDKYTTIRRKRKRSTKPGEMIFIFVGLRTSHCTKIAQAKIVDIAPITIYPFQFRTKLGGTFVAPALDLRNAQKDGFPNLVSFYKFFQQYKREILDDFEVITWDPKSVVSHVNPSEYMEASNGRE